MFTVGVTPTLAFRPIKPVSIGLGLSYYNSQVDFRQNVPLSMLTGMPVPGSVKQTVTGDGDGYGGNAGITWSINEQNQVAVTYRTPVSIDYDGESDIEGVGETDAKTSFKFPAVLGLGYGIKITDTIRIEFDAEWVQHSVFKDLNVELGGVEQTTPQDWNDAWTFGFGADWNFTPGWTLRGGYVYMPTPVPLTTLIPSVAEEYQNVVSLGLGYKRKHHAVDVGYAGGIFNGRHIEDNQNPAYNGDYDFVSQLMALTYSYSF